MIIPQFLKDDFKQYLLIINIILFSEIFTLLFLFVPSDFLTQSLDVLTFYIFFLIYFVASLLAPWLYIFFVDDTRKFLLVGSTSFTSFLLLLLLYFFVLFPIHIIIYFILLKSLMVGLSSLFKSLINLLDKKETLQKTNFNFQTEKHMDFTIKNTLRHKLHKIDILGGFFFLVLYPVIIVSITYVYFYVQL